MLLTKASQKEHASDKCNNQQYKILARIIRSLTPRQQHRLCTVEISRHTAIVHGIELLAVVKQNRTLCNILDHIQWEARGSGLHGLDVILTIAAEIQRDWYNRPVSKQVTE